MKYLLFLLAMLLPAVAFAAPQLQAEAPLYDFGKITEGSKIERTFRFQNTGDELLVISKVRSSCGCTAALLSADKIPPGEWGELKTRFNSKGFQGSVKKTVTIYSNDPQSQATRFRLQGVVLKELYVKPKRLRFSAGRTKAPFSATIQLRNDGSTPLFLSDLKTTSDELQAELSALRLDPGQSAEIAVRLDPHADKIRFAGYVTLRTSNPRSPVVRIPITAVLTNGS